MAGDIFGEAADVAEGVEVAETVFVCGDDLRCDWGKDKRDRIGPIGVGGRFFDTPELSASMMVDRSTESGGPGDGVQRESF